MCFPGIDLGAPFESAPAGDFQIEGEAAGLYVVTKNTSGLSIAAAAARIGDTPYATVTEAVMDAFVTHSDHSIVVTVIDGSFDAETYEYKSDLDQIGILWDGEAKTYSYAAASIKTSPNTSYYTTIGDALSAAESGSIKTVNLYKDVTANPVLPADVSLNLGNYTLDGTVTAASGCVPSKRIVNGNVVYTADPDTTGEEWTGAGSNTEWTNSDNWSLGFVPVANTPVTFPAGTHTVGITANNTGNLNKCASLTINGNVTLQRGINDWVVLYLHGAAGVSGTGTLTLNQVCMNNSYGSALEIACPMVVNGSNDSAMLGSAWAISGDVTVNGYFKCQVAVEVTGDASFANGSKVQTQKTMTFSGTTTLNGIVYRNTDYNYEALIFANVIVAAASSINGSGPTTFAGKVTLASGVTLTVPTTTTTVSGATFVTVESGKAVTSSVDGSNTIYAAAVVSISNDSEAESGYMENATAVITNTTTAITVPTSATAVSLAFSTGNSIELTSATVDLTATGKVIVYATDEDGAKTSTDISGAFTVTKDGDSYTVALDGGNYVNSVKVQPEVAASEPMTLTGDAPVFKIKTIPGLWYSVQSGTNPSSLSAGTPMQATGASTTLNQAAELGDEETVRYYKIAVGASKAALE